MDNNDEEGNDEQSMYLPPFFHFSFCILYSSPAPCANPSLPHLNQVPSTQLQAPAQVVHQNWALPAQFWTFSICKPPALSIIIY